MAYWVLGQYSLMARASSGMLLREVVAPEKRFMMMNSGSISRLYCCRLGVRVAIMMAREAMEKR